LLACELDIGILQRHLFLQVFFKFSCYLQDLRSLNQTCYLQVLFYLSLLWRTISNWLADRCVSNLFVVRRVIFASEKPRKIIGFRAGLTGRGLHKHGAFLLRIVLCTACELGILQRHLLQRLSGTAF